MSEATSRFIGNTSEVVPPKGEVGVVGGTRALPEPRIERGSIEP